MSRYYDDELYHHGIKGQKWGVRRFQNPDGSRKKRINNKISKNLNSVRDTTLSNKSFKGRDLKAYYSAVEKMDNGLSEKYHREYESKNPGKDYFDDPDYWAGHEKLFTNVYHTEYNRMLQEDIRNSKGYKKTQRLISKYGKLVLDDANKQSLEELEQLKRYN